MSLSPVTYYLIPLRSKHISQSSGFKRHPPFRLRDQLSHRHKTANKIVKVNVSFSLFLSSIPCRFSSLGCLENV
jgi:hypothetical protein